MGVSLSGTRQRCQQSSSGSKGTSLSLKGESCNTQSTSQMSASERKNQFLVHRPHVFQTSEEYEHRRNSNVLSPTIRTQEESNGDSGTGRTEDFSGGSQSIFVANLPTFVNVDEVKTSSGRGIEKSTGTFQRRASNEVTQPEFKTHQLSLYQHKEGHYSPINGIAFSEKNVYVQPPSARRRSQQQHEEQKLLLPRVLCSSVTSTQYADTRRGSKSVASEGHSNVDSITDVPLLSSSRGNPNIQNDINNARTLKNAKAVLLKHVHRSFIHNSGTSGLSSGLQCNRSGSDVAQLRSTNPLVGSTTSVSYPHTPARDGKREFVDSSTGKHSKNLLISLNLSSSRSCPNHNNNNNSNNNYLRYPDATLIEGRALVELMETSMNSGAVEDSVADSVEQGSRLCLRRLVRSVEHSPSPTARSPDCSSQRERIRFSSKHTSEVQRLFKSKDREIPQVNGVTHSGSITHSSSNDDPSTTINTTTTTTTTTAGNGNGNGNSNAIGIGGDSSGWVAIGAEAGVGSLDWYARLRQQCRLEELETTTELGPAKETEITNTNTVDENGDDGNPLEYVVHGATIV